MTLVCTIGISTSLIFSFRTVSLLIPSTPVPKGFNTFLCREDVKNEEGEIIFDETHYGETLTTNYGDPLYYIIIKDLLQLSNHVSVIGNYTNKAVWGYLENSLPERRIALMWS